MESLGLINQIIASILTYLSCVVNIVDELQGSIQQIDIQVVNRKLILLFYIYFR